MWNSIIKNVIILLVAMKINCIANNAINSIRKPLFKFGVIADVQYVDAPDGTNFQKTHIRRYRQSLDILRTACTNWNSLVDPIQCAVVLGDMLDGQTAMTNVQEKCLNDILEVTDATNYPFHFCFGNHDYYAFNRTDLYQNFIPKDFSSHFTLNREITVGGPCSPEKLYYDFSPYPGFRFIFLDSYDISLIGATDIESKKLAERLLAENNPNDLKKSGHWFNNLPFEKYRWVPYNGGIGKSQMKWFNELLQHSKENSERVVVFCHQPIYAPNHPQSVIWNSDEILESIYENGNVCTWIAGHDHGGQYQIDEYGIHHLVPPAPLECDEGEVAFGHFEVFDNHMALKWTGKKPKRTIHPWSDNMKLDLPAIKKIIY